MKDYLRALRTKHTKREPGAFLKVPERIKTGGRDKATTSLLHLLPCLHHTQETCLHLVACKALGLQRTDLTLGALWSSHFLPGWGHVSRTPLHRAASSAINEKPWMSNLDVTQSQQVLISVCRASGTVAGSFTSVAVVTNPRGTPFSHELE